jgi:hypothetical protein
VRQGFLLKYGAAVDEVKGEIRRCRDAPGDDCGASGTLPHAFRKMTICSSMHDFDCFHLSLGYDFARSTQPAGCRNNLFLRDAGVRRGAEALTQGA